MSYSVENRTDAELRSDLDWYHQTKLRISSDYLNLKNAINTSSRRSLPKSGIKDFTAELIEFAEVKHELVQERLKQQTDKIFIEIAKRLQQHDTATPH